MSTITESAEPSADDSTDDPADDVVENAPAARWAVETGVWTELPDDVVALVATPLVVCAESR